MTPALIKPSKICILPAINTANRKVSKAPRSSIAENTITASPAAGPLTPSGDPLIDPTMIPPMIPAITPENRNDLISSGGSDASAIPKQSGTATKNTTILAGMSFDRFSKIPRFFFELMIFEIVTS